MRLRRIVVLVSLVAVLLGCGHAAQRATLLPTATAALSPTSTVLPTPTAVPTARWLARWLAKEPCAAPCWEGVTLGVTDPDAAVAIWRQSPVVASVKQDDDPQRLSYIVVYLIGGPEAEVTYDRRTTPVVVDSIRFDGDVVLVFSDVIAAYGEPSHIIAEGASDLFYFANMIYAAQGIWLQASSSHVLTLTSQLTFDSIGFSSPMSSDDEFLIKEATPWQGFRDYEFYCHVDEHQDCHIIEEQRAIKQIADAGSRLRDDEPAPVFNSGPVEVAGFYATSFEQSAFRPCHGGQKWWTEGNFGDNYDEIVPWSGAPVYVRLRGELSMPGSYGHLGGYPRQFTVTEELEMRLPQPGDCD